MARKIESKTTGGAFVAAIPPLALLTVTATALIPLLFCWGGGQTLAASHDNYFQTLPLVTEAFRQWSAGQIPVMTTGMYGGFPLLAQVHAQVLYFPNYMFSAAGATDPVLALDATAALHGVLLGGGWWLLLGRAKLHPVAAAAGAATILCAGVVQTGLWYWTQFFYAAMWFPYFLLALDHARARGWPPGGWHTLAALAGAMLFLTGHPQIFAIHFLAAAAWVLLERPAEAEPASSFPTAFGRRIAALSIVAGLIVLLTAVQWLPTRSLLAQSARAEGFGFEEYAMYSLRANAGLLRDLVLPGAPAIVPAAVNPPFPLGNIVFLGIPALLLATVGLLGGFGRRGWRFGAVALGGAFLLAWEGAQPFLFRVPGITFFRNPAKWWLLAACGAGVLVAVGADTILARIRNRRLAATATLLLLCVVVGHGAWATAAQCRYKRAIAVTDPAKWGGVFGTVLAAPLPSAAEAENDSAAEAVSAHASTRRLQLRLLPDHARAMPDPCGNLFLLKNGEDACLHGLGPFENRALREAGLIEPAIPGFLPAETARRLAKADASPAPALGARGALVGEDGTVPLPPPRTRFRLAATGVDHDDAVRLDPPTEEPLDPSPMDWVDTRGREGDTLLVTEVETARGGCIVTTRPYLPGWTVRIDGKRIRTRCADGLTLACRVPAGKHEVHFSYEAPGLLPGGILSAVGAALCLLCCLPARGRRKTA